MYVDPDPECDEEGWGTARATAAPLAVTIALGGAYVATYSLERLFTYPDLLGEYGLALQFVVLAALVVCHEAIHAGSYLLVGLYGVLLVATDVNALIDLWRPPTAPPPSTPPRPSHQIPNRRSVRRANKCVPVV
jgi:hypothetical protein